MTNIPGRKRRTKASSSNKRKRPKVPLKPAQPSRGPTARAIRYQQRSAAKIPALTQVLRTPELLECILLHLDIRTLLVSAQLACRAWQELIMASPMLQTALFFRPEGDGADTGRAGARQNPLLAHVFPALFPNEHSIASSALLNPQDPNAATFSTRSDGIPGFVGFERRGDIFLRPRASWERMLVQQPPACHIGTWTTTFGWATSQSASLTYYKDGLKMGQLYDIVTSTMGVNCSTRCVVWKGPGTVMEQRREGGGLMQVAGPDLLANCPPRVPGAREKLDDLARKADLVLAGYLYQSCTDVMDEQYTFLQILLSGGTPANFGYIRKSSRKGKSLWRWEGYDMDNDEDL